ncbi:GSCFA domain-containing protein [Microvirga roseola]|uniref:GSCFA domain-containing protein n=1 Tax=Microvirga roseola TaxID=2883126 RepID=UPI001E55D251|nr:GSCFA domain-containing protein [Microvirga roseola]
MSKAHPYVGAPDYQIWKKEPGISHPEAFDPVTHASFKIQKSDPVVTAGSCFAQHVARYLSTSGFNFLVTEKSHPIVHAEVAEKSNYGTFSARYGNIYTARQLRQLLERAFGLFHPIESSWHLPSGVTIDPFRPQIQESGFISTRDLLLDREVHFEAVRNAVSQMSVFVFTLGLTECWEDSRDGAVFPLAPGVAGGEFDPSIYRLRNCNLEEIVTDLDWCISFIRNINPGVRFLFTVSPVPLNATAIDRHVFVSTTYSKSALRVAAEQICNSHELCDYFPSFEIITSPYARGKYYGPDCRSVTESGVAHVMRLFLKHYGEDCCHTAPSNYLSPESETQKYIREMDKVVEVLCDEERISN